MRIGFFTDSYLPIKYGMETMIESFRVGLEKLGNEVFIYGPEFPGYIDQNPNVFRFKSWQPSAKADMRLSIPKEKTRRLRTVLQHKLDIVNAQTPFSLGLIGLYIGRRQKIPVIYTHHTDFPECVRAYMGNWLLLPYISEKYTKWFSNRCTAVIAPSVKMKTTLLASGVRKPIYVVPNGVNLKTFKQTQESKIRALKIREKYGISAADKLVMTLSRVGKEKNIEMMIRSFALATRKGLKAKLMIVGKGPYLEEARVLAQHLGAENKIFFTGFVPDEEKPFYYQAGDVFFYTSYNDVQAVVVLEAIASGLPVVAADDTAFHGMVEHEVNGLFVGPGTEEAFARNITDIISDDKRMQSMAQESKRIAQKYSEDKTTSQLLDLYKSLIEDTK